MKLPLQITLLFMLGLESSCKSTTKPQSADCDIGFLPCEDNMTECCEVICEDNYYNCGEFLTECCLDSTSHSFSWSIDTLGNYGSYLNDVWIVDENNIWVVGNIEFDEGEYNATIWNGSEWEFIGIYSNTLDLYSIWYFNENNIWVTSHCFPYHWDGNTWTQYHLNNMGMPGVCAGSAIWAGSPDDMYFVGLNGSIVHYDGTNFEQLDSGTNIKLRSITGSGEHIWIAGYQDFIGAILLEYRNNTFETVYFNPGNYWDVKPDSISGKTMAVWTNNPDSINVLTPSGIYRVPHGSTGEGKLTYNYWQGFPWSIGGNSNNDIFTGGDYSSIYHYNGSTFHKYNEFTGHISTHSIEMKGNLVCLVGEDYATGKAIIIRGIR